MSERELPNDVKSEAGLLAIFLHQKEDKALTQCLDAGLTPDMFFDKKLELVARACWELYADVRPINKENVVAMLKELKTLEEAGGEATVAALDARKEHESKAPYFIEIIKEKAFRRRLITTAAKHIQKHLDNPNDMVIKWINQAIENQFLPVGQAVTPDGPTESEALKKMVADAVFDLFAKAKSKDYSLCATVRYLESLVKALKKREKGE